MPLTRLLMVEVNIIENGDILDLRAELWSRFVSEVEVSLTEGSHSLTRERKKERRIFDTLWFSVYRH